jgi:hypothetical protein
VAGELQKRLTAWRKHLMVLTRQEMEIAAARALDQSYALKDVQKQGASTDQTVEPSSL